MKDSDYRAAQKSSRRGGQKSTSEGLLFSTSTRGDWANEAYEAFQQRVN